MAFPGVRVWVWVCDGVKLGVRTAVSLCALPEHRPGSTSASAPSAGAKEPAVT